MKLGYLILEKIKKAPEESYYRMFTEEKVKWIMEKVDETDDIEHLERTVCRLEVSRRRRSHRDHHPRTPQRVQKHRLHAE